MHRLYHAAQQQTTNVTQLSLFDSMETDVSHETSLEVFTTMMVCIEQTSPQILKRCSNCKNEKPLDAFSPLASGKYGRKSACKECTNAINRAKAIVRQVSRPTSKTCIICNQEKPSSDFPQKGTQRCSNCREAAKDAYNKGYNLAHREQAKERSHRHYIANREKVIERTGRYHREHPEIYREATREWQKNNVEKRRAYARTPKRRYYNREYLRRTRSGNPKWQAYYREYGQRPEVRAKKLEYLRKRSADHDFKAYKRWYRLGHPEQDVRQAERKRLRYAANPKIGERIQEINAKWRAENPLKAREQHRRRHARERRLLTRKVDYKAILERDRHVCCICGKNILLDRGHKLHFDHVVPLARGGSHTMDNIRPAHDVCNMRKNARLMSELTAFDRRGPDDMTV